MGCGSKATPRDLALQFPRSPWTPGASAPDGLGRVVQGIVTALLRDGYPDLRSVAKSIGLSVRTLQRRLSREGVTYARVVAQARLEIAQRMLDDPSRRVIEVALDLGYSDQAHFGRYLHAGRAWPRASFGGSVRPDSASMPMASTWRASNTLPGAARREVSHDQVRHRPPRSASSWRTHSARRRAQRQQAGTKRATPTWRRKRRTPWRISSAYRSRTTSTSTPARRSGASGT